MTRPVSVLAGPTASGKTAVALDIAEALGAEIISVDSRQIYRGLRIGSAAPTPEERARVPHHLVEERDPDSPITAGDYGKLVRQRLATIRSSGSDALLVGGSGLYLHAALGGLDEALPADPSTRAALESRAQEQGVAAMHAELAAVDPPSADAIGPADRQRILRALEIYALTGSAPSSLRSRGRATTVEARVVVLTWDRDALEGRIRFRVRAMIEAGLQGEVEALLARGLDPSLPALNSVGYAETVSMLDGSLAKEDWEERMVINTRRYAKRQRTWFRSVPGAQWVTAEASSHPQETLRTVREALA